MRMNEKIMLTFFVSFYPGMSFFQLLKQRIFVLQKSWRKIAEKNYKQKIYFIYLEFSDAKTSIQKYEKNSNFKITLNFYTFLTISKEFPFTSSSTLSFIANPFLFSKPLINFHALNLFPKNTLKLFRIEPTECLRRNVFNENESERKDIWRRQRRGRERRQAG